MNWNAFIDYSMKDVELCKKVQDRIIAHYRIEYLPRYGSAWENMMYHDMASHYKEQRDG
jgi:hypothetical protein